MLKTVGFNPEMFQFRQITPGRDGGEEICSINNFFKKFANNLKTSCQQFANNPQTIRQQFANNIETLYQQFVFRFRVSL